MEDYGTKNIHFGSRRFQARVKRVYTNRQVFVLNVPPNRTACWLSLWMPQLVLSWLQWLLPEWFLPPTVIMKERNPTKADSYENEVDTYLFLRGLQGCYIPRMFGEVTSSNPGQPRYKISKRPTPAMLLENVEGKLLHNLSAEELRDSCLHDQLKEMYEMLTQNGVVHGDPKLHNFFVAEGRVKAIDFEFSYPLPSDITNEHELEDLKDRIEGRLRELSS